MEGAATSSTTIATREDIGHKSVQKNQRTRVLPVLNQMEGQAKGRCHLDDWGNVAEDRQISIRAHGKEPMKRIALMSLMQGH